MSSTASPMTLLDIYVAPKSLFSQFKAAKVYSYVAFVLMLALTAGSMFVFYDGMSPQWIVDQQMLNMSTEQMSPSEIDATKDIMAQTAGSIGIITAVSVIIMMTIITAIYAGYFTLAAKLGGENREPMAYGDWFSFSIWAQMPTVIGTLGFILLFMTAGTADLPISLPNYASLNQLLLGVEPGQALYTWAEAVNLFSLWTIAIAAIGLKKLCNISMGKAVMLSALPWVTIFGIWFITI